MHKLILFVVLLFVISSCFALGNAEGTWDCPQCGRKGNTDNYCENCAHPSPTPTPDLSSETAAAETAIIAAKGEKVKIGVSMPTDSLQRWNEDGKNMEKMLNEAGFEPVVQYASNDVSIQLKQIETMIDDGAKVLIIAAIDASSLGQALDKAAEKGCKVIAYDRLLYDNVHVDYYVTFSNFKVGVVQGEFVEKALDLANTEGPFTIEFTAGEPCDNNAGLFFSGAMSVLKKYIEEGKVVVISGQTEFADVATPSWKSENAQMRAEKILSTYYADGRKLDAWVCSNDTTAYGITNALEANYDIWTYGWPIITGQDCDKANVRNMIAGKQAMSVFKDTRTLAAQAVKIAGQILKGEEVDVNDRETYDNNKKVVPSFLCDPVIGTAENYKELLIDSGYYTEDDLK